MFQDGNGITTHPTADPIYCFPVVQCTDGDDGDGWVNVGDIVYLINFVFKDGPPPCEPAE